MPRQNLQLTGQIFHRLDKEARLICAVNQKICLPTPKQRLESSEPFPTLSAYDTYKCTLISHKEFYIAGSRDLIYFKSP